MPKLWFNQCLCWSEKVYVWEALRSGNTKSCWCYRESIIWKNKRLYQIYRWMRQRCYDKNHISYKTYWWKWITIEWLSFSEFYSDMIQWYIAHAEIHGEGNTTIDRIDSDSSYSTKNCKWSTLQEQAQNTSKKRYVTFLWAEYRISHLAKKLWVRTSQIHYRISIWTNLDMFYSYHSKNK